MVDLQGALGLGQYESERTVGSEASSPSGRSFGDGARRKRPLTVTYHGEDLNAEGWARSRVLALSVWRSRAYDVVLMGSIVVTIVMVVLETDAVAKGSSPESWVSVTSDVILVLYICDIALRVFIFRASYAAYLGNWADVAIVLSDVGVLAYQYFTRGGATLGFSFLRVFRLLRLGQAMHVLEMFPELHLMIKGMTGAFKVLMWGLAVLLLMLLVWSILAVQLIHPLNRELAHEGVYEGVCERCPRAFESVSATMLTFVKHLIAGDGWGEVCVPISEAHPWTFFFFFLAVASSVTLALLNLILAVIVDSAAQARSENEHDLAAMKDKEFKKQRKQLTRLFKTIDTDGSGLLSWDELNEAIFESKEFNDTLICMGISVHDLDMVWMLLDDQDTGSVTCDNFVEQLYRLRATDNHNVNLLMKGLLLRIREDMRSLLVSNGGQDVGTRSCGLGVRRSQRLPTSSSVNLAGGRKSKSSCSSQSQSADHHVQETTLSSTRADSRDALEGRAEVHS